MLLRAIDLHVTTLSRQQYTHDCALLPWLRTFVLTSLRFAQQLLLDAGFVLERFAEPRPGNEAALQYPGLQAAQVFPFFRIVHARRPS